MGGESKEGPSARRTALIVAGMHRSGTSAVARLLMLLGADGPRNLMPARRGNEAGHWESKPIVDLHDEILATASMTWDDVSPFPVAWLTGPSGEAFRRRAIELVESEYGDSTLFMVKDPRICRLIPFWRSILEELGVEAAFVLPQRNPLEAAASLKERDGIPTPHGLLLWLRHALDAEAATRDLPRAFVSYERLLRDWEAVSRAISGRLGIDWPGRSHQAKLAVEQFISAAGRHHEFTPEELEARPEIVDWVKRAHSVLAAAADTNGDPDPEELDELRSLLRDADLAYGPVLAETGQELAETGRERDNLAAERDGLAGELRARDEVLAQRGVELEQMAAEVNRRQAELKTAERELSHRDAELERMAAELSAAKDERERVTAGIADEVQRVRGELAEVTAAIGQVAEAVEEQSQGTLRGLARRIGDRRRSASQFLSWILVRPSKERRGYASTYLALRRSGAFDADFYRSHYADIRRTRQNPLMHYIEHGVWEGRDPNAEFSTNAYLAAHPEAGEPGENALLHWVRAGKKPVPPSLARRPRPQRELRPVERRPAREQARAGAGEVRAFREFVAGAIPDGGVALVASDGRSELLALTGLEARTFPDREGDGIVEPIGSTAAVAQLEWERARGAEYLVLPEITRQWWATLPEFQQYVNRHYRRAPASDHGVIAHLDSSPTGGRPWQARLHPLLQQYQARFPDPPSILDLTEEMDVQASFPELTVVVPVDGSDSLPYLDDSIDLVMLGATVGETAQNEARRVASKALIELAAGTERIDWLSEPQRTLPSISILIPSHDGAELLDQCLSALAETIPGHLQAEVLVIDDGSEDSTPDLLGHWSRRDDRIRHLRNDGNLGFIDCCNRAAAEAGGETLVFLNNDTIPIDGWLQPLMETLIDRKDAGAVGGMLLYPSGTLQEAGGVIFSDGSAANFGNGESPDDATYRFVRAVDYCSGALLATRREVFEEHGGFDTAYRPGYYEDADYCFRLRRAGLSTYYQPRSAIIHLEGGTAGTDLSTGPKRFQVTNRETFSNRWADELTKQAHPPNGFDRAVWAQLARRRLTVGSR